MPTYEGSPFGIIHGAIGDVQAQTWKGIPVLRTKTNSPNPNTVKQQATRNTLTVFSKISSDYFNNLIKPIWNPLAKRLKLQMTGHNLFFKTSLRTVRNTTREGLQDADLSVMQVSSGSLEPTPKITSTNYNEATGALTIGWDTTVCGVGSPDDRAFLAACIPDGTLWLGSDWMRSDGSGTLTIPAATSPVGLSSFVYFWDGCQYSPSVGIETARGQDEIFGDDETTRITNSITFESILNIKWVEVAEMAAMKWYAEIKNAEVYIAGVPMTFTTTTSNTTDKYVIKEGWAWGSTAANAYGEIQVMMKVRNGTKAKMKSIHIFTVTQ